MEHLLQRSFWNNTVLEWSIAIAIILISFFVIRLIRNILLRKLKYWSTKTNTSWDNFLLAMIEKSVVPMLYVSSIYFALKTLVLPVKVTGAIHVGFLVCLTYFVLKVISAAFRKFVFNFIQKEGSSEGKEKQASGLIMIVNGMIWILGVVFLIDNLGYNVTTLIAGLGIGGIAIALAAQAILGDLFSYFVIFFDRPFEIGDFVVLDDKSGVVEYIGIKTTRLRTLSGEQLVCSNTDLTNARLHNYKRMQKRRIVFQLGVTYQTTHSQLAAIPGIVKEIVEKREQLAFDRGHFSGFGDSSLNFEFVYNVMDADYSIYMDNQQAVYLDIYAAFEKEGIEFAYPTQTLFVQSEASVSLKKFSDHQIN